MGMMRRLAMAAGLVTATALAYTPAAAQATIGADVALNTHYVWRGLSLTNKFPVIQPDVWLSAYGFTAGVWANLELSKCDDVGDICETGFGGNAIRSGVGEVDIWLEYNRTVGNAALKGGGIAYRFFKDNRYLGTTFNTVEIYGQVSLTNLPVTPTVYASYDINNIKGLYLQGGLSYGVKASPALTINLGALAGFSAGQEVNATPDPGEDANFFESGLTHVDLSASTSFAAGPLSIGPSVHFQISNDEFTKINGAELADQDEDVKVWVGVLLSWSRALSAAKE